MQPPLIRLIVALAVLIALAGAAGVVSADMESTTTETAMDATDHPSQMADRLGEMTQLVDHRSHDPGEHHNESQGHGEHHDENHAGHHSERHSDHQHGHHGEHHDAHQNGPHGSGHGH